MARTISTAAGRINGAYGEVAWTPIRYVNRAYSRTVLAGPLPFRPRRAGDALARRHEPGRQGIRRCARRERPGRSDPVALRRRGGRMHGAALLVNPYDPEAVATSIAHALSMPLEERRQRHDALFRVISGERHQVVGRAVPGQPAAEEREEAMAEHPPPHPPPPQRGWRELPDPRGEPPPPPPPAAPSPRRPPPGQREALLTSATWVNACGKLPTSRPRAGRIPRSAGRRRCAAPAAARTARAPPSSGRAGHRRRPARSCRPGTRPRPAAGRPRLAPCRSAARSRRPAAALDRRDGADARAGRRAAGSRPPAAAAGWRRAASSHRPARSCRARVEAAPADLGVDLGAQRAPALERAVQPELSALLTARSNATQAITLEW